MRQRIEVARRHGEHGVEQRGVADSQRLRGQSPGLRVAVEGVCPSALLEADSCLLIAAKYCLAGRAMLVTVGHLDEVRPEPLDRHDVDRVITSDAGCADAGNQLLESGPKSVLTGRIA
ncbi:MAG: hypothetical protein JO063_12240 [Pseudonocardiales bacterium]|nr:hypothetical protein [Pseudonocardiales bacterium]MBV9031540.1 hypothetical protein [Pseudonocardiales bacterium]MBW0010860.1 hypothetical protein [Pseudonocardiales bacterium]